ncbi:MAG: sulfatase-like hydrolase/transferase [Clostridia bacterium]|nr:sulfatase-like hydrolase/transferase [Clostridia bacterium]
MTKKPHIIIFNPDEMRWDTMSHMGNPAAQTPFLDAFAREEAVSFSHAYCQNPVCVPSRCSFFTGLYPHVHGHRTMAHLLHPGEASLFSELKDAGYYVWMNDRNDLTAGQIPGWTESHATEIYYGGQKEIGPGPVNPNLRGQPGGKHFYDHLGGQLKTNEQGINYNGDDEAVDAAIDRIRNRPADQPLCVFLGLIYPHCPYQVEEPYYSAIDRSRLPARIRAEECTGKSRILDAIREINGLYQYTDEDWDELRAIYLGMCSKVDAQFRRLVDALKEEGIYDDCAIFFLSDHGDFAGDYGLVEKAQNTFEECLTRVPLLIKPPKGYDLDAGISDALVELVDFYATAMEMAGVEPTHTQFGRSLTPLLADRTLPGREFVCSEGGRLPGETHCDECHLGNGKMTSPMGVYWPKQKAQTEDLAHSKGIMLRDRRYKYVSRLQGSDELYDLEQDPGERTNMIQDPALKDTVTEMRCRMLKWLEATADIVPFHRDDRFTPEMMIAKGVAAAGREHEAEIRARVEQGASFMDIMAYSHELANQSR